MIKFTIEESNLICICNTDTQAGILAEFADGPALHRRPDMRAVAENATAKLGGMTEVEFTAITFESVPPNAEDEHGGG